MSSRPALDKMAMEYASLAPSNYQSGRFSGTYLEAQRSQLRSLMEALSNVYDAQEAIKRAERVLKLVDYHSDFDGPTPDKDDNHGFPF